MTRATPRRRRRAACPKATTREQKVAVVDSTFGIDIPVVGKAIEVGRACRIPCENLPVQLLMHPASLGGVEGGHWSMAGRNIHSLKN